MTARWTGIATAIARIPIQWNRESARSKRAERATAKAVDGGRVAEVDEGLSSLKERASLGLDLGVGRTK